MADGIQLEMNFDGAMGNRFKEKLDNGNFQVLVEVNAPPAETPLEDAAARFSDIEYLVSSKQEINAALAFTDRYAYPDALDTIQFASALCRTDREAARSAILNKLGEKKLQKMQAAEAIRETARLCRQEKDEAKKAELRAKLREQLAEQYNRTTEEIGSRLRIQEQRLAAIRQAYQKRVENADSAVDAQLERMLHAKPAKQSGQSGKRRK